MWNTCEIELLYSAIQEILELFHVIVSGSRKEQWIVTCIELLPTVDQGYEMGRFTPIGPTVEEKKN